MNFPQFPQGKMPGGMFPTMMGNIPSPMMQGGMPSFMGGLPPFMQGGGGAAPNGMPSMQSLTSSPEFLKFAREKLNVPFNGNQTTPTTASEPSNVLNADGSTTNQASFLDLTSTNWIYYFLLFYYINLFLTSNTINTTELRRPPAVVCAANNLRESFWWLCIFGIILLGSSLFIVGVIYSDLQDGSYKANLLNNLIT